MYVDIVLWYMILYYIIMPYYVITYYVILLLLLLMVLLLLLLLLLHPVHLLRVSLLRVLESNFPGDSLWNSTDIRVPPLMIESAWVKPSETQTLSRGTGRIIIIIIIGEVPLLRQQGLAGRAGALRAGLRGLRGGTGEGHTL